MTRIPEKLYGIIGHPLGHTMSPALHNWGFERCGIAAAYMAFPTPPEKLADFIAAFRTLPLSGASVTIPHKETVMPLLDGITPLAQTVGAVNTLFWDKGRLMGDNTDITGFLSPLRQHADRIGSALVLGAGGAAKAVLAGLRELGVADVGIANRSQERAVAVAEPFGATVVPWEERTAVKADLIINSTPLGMSGDKVEETPCPQAAFAGRSGIAYDLVYNPLRTRFLAEAEAAGWQTLDGLHMFAAQGMEQFRIWTGVDLPLEDVRERIRSILSL
ncbi:shikimate dehydrogenase [Desulfovibrio mangrovi]|uniref:shikimate dehydrogenase n=1 Tax=Desulfovibrio mangrovi TaxID=2976983 RepID=UPI002245DBC6|nr:shikimate dehydrogenase [Desulfovibrio mangrovi]UZP66418.1 shikimate dehydrogenase [Desulfovibrio mangrovi]